MDAHTDSEHSDVYTLAAWGDTDGNHEGKVEVMMYLYRFTTWEIQVDLKGKVNDLK